MTLTAPVPVINFFILGLPSSFDKVETSNGYAMASWHSLCFNLKMMDPHQQLVRSQLKILLLYLAAHSPNPGSDLKTIVDEVIQELYTEVKDFVGAKPNLRLVESSENN